MEGGPSKNFISLEFDWFTVILSFFDSRFLTPCFFATLFKEQCEMIEKTVNINIIFFMIKNYINIYNNLIKLTSNKSLYIGLENQDVFSDRLSLFLFHFAFFLKEFKHPNHEIVLQNVYDYNFKQLEHSIREIGYGDQTINKMMKKYLNLFHSILSEIHFWDTMTLEKKYLSLSKFLQNFNNIKSLVVYFDNFSLNLKKYDLNSYLKSVKE